MTLRHFTDLFVLTEAEARTLLDDAVALKARTARGEILTELAGKTLGLLFEKPSLRTRVSFEAAAHQLGGSAIFLSAREIGLGVRETVPDVARVLSQYVHALAVRTFSQATVEELAQHATIPVINALSDAAHPCQAMADLMTVQEALGHTQDVQIAFVGDGNNVARSLAVAAALLGARFRLCGPAEYQFPAEFLARFEKVFPSSSLEQSTNAREALADCDVIYTDVWTSMGQEDETAARIKVFEPYRVDQSMMSLARPEAIFLHCLPAHRGEEVTEAVLDGPQSLVIPQAANRLHFQKALLRWLMSRDAAASQTPRAKFHDQAADKPTSSRRRTRTG